MNLRKDHYRVLARRRNAVCTKELHVATTAREQSSSCASLYLVRERRGVPVRPFGKDDGESVSKRAFKDIWRPDLRARRPAMLDLAFCSVR